MWDATGHTVTPLPSRGATVETAPRRRTHRLRGSGRLVAMSTEERTHSMTIQNAGALSSTDVAQLSQNADREDLIEIIGTLLDRVEELESKLPLLNALHKKVSTIEENQEDYQEQNERDKAEIRKYATEKAEETGVSTSNSEGQADQTPEAETSLEQIVAFPEHMVEEQLSANQERARFIAKDFEQYSQDCPAGRYIEAREMRRVIHAMNGKCNTNTLSRVRKFLNRLGDDEVKIVERRGTKKVVFTDELVERLKQLRRCNPKQASDRNRAAV